MNGYKYFVLTFRFDDERCYTKYIPRPTNCRKSTERKAQLSILSTDKVNISIYSPLRVYLKMNKCG